MKHLLLSLSAVLLTIAASAQETPGWIRKNVISPDGKIVAFSYKGDIYTVPSTGGQARRLTSNAAYESDPVWAPNGKTLVFTSTREGSKDLFSTPREGGDIKRLTTLPGTEMPLAIDPQGRVYFSWYHADLQSPGFDGFPGDPALYRIPLEGGAPELVTSLTISALSINSKGDILYEDWKGYEDPLRKHHTSSVTRDIWLCQPSAPGIIDAKGRFTQLSTYQGEDRNPVFAADGNSFYFLSEQDGKTSNVYRSSLGNPREQVQLTHFDRNPVRFLSVAGDGTIAYSYDGDLYVNHKKLEISLLRDEDEKQVARQTLRNASDIAVSPDGKEIALIMRGDVFVTSVEYATTRRITNTPEQERGIAFSPDGRDLYYASERGGCWSIWRSRLSRKEDTQFTYAVDITEERVSPEGETSFQMEISPDGKMLAYLRNRTELVILPTKGGTPKTLHKDVNYSYSDGDQDFAWSPDSRYILCNWQADGGWNNQDIALIEVESGKITNLTRSGYSDGDFRWALGGKAMTFTSDKNGYRSHGSWGAEDDIYIMFFEGKAYTQFGLSKEQKDIEKMLMGEKAVAKAEKKEQKDSLKGKVNELKPELELRDVRIRRLTRFSNAFGDHYLTEDGSKLFFTQRLEKGFDLCSIDIEKGDITVVKKGVSGRFTPSKDGKSIFIASGNSVSKLDVATGKDKPVTFTGEFEFKAQKEREYIFEHCWKQVKEKFYVEDLHGVDWDFYHKQYAEKLPFINNDYDFADLLSEMLGELNGSHTGARYRPQATRNIGHLGVLYDLSYTGDGLRIAEILPGGVLSNTDSEIKAGDVIVSIEGHAIKAGEDWMPLLYERAGKKTILMLKHDGKEKEYIVTPAATDANLLYERWVRQREEKVAQLSGGRVGYVHIKGMDSPSYRELYSKALGKYRGCEALIVDTRHNGGGWLHDDLVTFLGGREYCLFTPRGQYIGHEPFNKWTRPSCVLIGEDNYSDASGFPLAYRNLGIGKLIGAAVPGTMTAVWWENQINRNLVFGIPQVGNFDTVSQRYIENNQIEPDIRVYNTPASVLDGRDLQLEAAVKEMLKAIEK